MLPKDAPGGPARYAAVGRTLLSAILIGPLAENSPASEAKFIGRQRPDEVRPTP